MKTLLPALLLLSTAMFAQTPPNGRPHGGPPERGDAGHIAMMTTLLSLSSGQQSQASTIYATARASQKGVQTNMRAAQTSLAAAIKKNDVAAIETLSTQIGTLHSQTLSIQSKAEAAFYATLTPEQQTKYDTLNHGGFGGPGGPGGPRGEFRGPRPPQQ
jgi:Spy/CpxP family protein refolding chaperone